METLSGKGDDMLQIVSAYKNMAADTSKHKVIIKDKTMVQFLAYSLDSTDESVVEASLDTLNLLIQNRSNHNELRNTFGIMESILATSKRDDVKSKLTRLALRLHTALESSAYSQSNSLPSTPVKSRKSLATVVYTFHVFGLNEDVKGELEECLVKIRGVVSVVIDVRHQRTFVRVIQDGPQADVLASDVSSKTHMSLVLVVKNSKGQEVLKTDSLDKTDNSEDLPNYLPEEDSPVNEKAILSFDRIKTNASSWVRSASAFLQEAFYW